MSSEEFAEWCAFDRMNPGEPERSDLQAAMIASVIANSNKGKKGKAFGLDDFMLKFKKDERIPRTGQEVGVKLKSWLSQYNLDFMKKKK